MPGLQARLRYTRLPEAWQGEGMMEIKSQKLRDVTRIDVKVGYQYIVDYLLDHGLTEIDGNRGVLKLMRRKSDI
jgi:hypothetical protein